MSAARQDGKRGGAPLHQLGSTPLKSWMRDSKWTYQRRDLIMKRQIQISAKNIGALALDSFCPKCFWVRMMIGDRLPFQIFPGIFSSIDSYSKNVTRSYFLQHGRVPTWFDGFGELGAPIAVPGWPTFQVVDPETNIRLTGVPDEILRHATRGIWIIDYKTGRCTNTQDALTPMYKIQLNCYGMIAQNIGIGPVYGLGLLYYEPVTDIASNERDILIKPDSFLLQFAPKLKPVKFEPNIIPPLLRQVRKICDCPDSPPPRLDCRDCYLLETLIRGARPAFVFLGESGLRNPEARRYEKQGKDQKLRSPK